MKAKILGVLLMLIVGLVGASALVSAQVNQNTVTVYLDNIALEQGNSTYFRVVERGESLPLKVTFTADSTSGNDQDMEIRAEIFADEHGDEIASESNVFVVQAGGVYTKKLDLPLTKRMDSGQYTVWLTIAGRTDEISNVRIPYRINVDLPRNQVDIKDVMFSPEGVVKAGRALLATVRIENNGYRTEDGVKVEVSIPELQLSAATYIDELKVEGTGDDQTTSEELYLRIPECAEAGDYTAYVNVKYDDGDKTSTVTKKIRVIPGDACTLTAGLPGTTLPTSGPSTVIKVQDVSTGQGASVYQMTLTNNGASSKAYTINVNTGDKLDATVQPGSTVVVGAGDSESVIVFVSPKAGTAPGQYGFSVIVSSGSDVLKQIPMTTTVAGTPVVASNTSSLKRGLEIGLVVLVVLLVILGLIIGFNKLKGEEQEDTEGTKTYY